MIKKQYNGGFSLLELLLSVVVLATLFAGATVLFDDWFKRSIDRKVAREMKQLQVVAEEYVRLNFDTILTTNIPNLNDVAEINIANMIAQGFLPPIYIAENSYKQSIRVFVRYIAS